MPQAFCPSCNQRIIREDGQRFDGHGTGCPLRFVAIGHAILRGGHTIARAISKTMAKRIANALNRHKTNSEGV